MPESASYNMLGGDFWILISAVGLAACGFVLLHIYSRRKARNAAFSGGGVSMGRLLGKNDNIRGRTFVVTRDGLVLGRVGDVCDVICDNVAVSREHAKVYPAGGRIVLLDLNSKNGTYVNGRRVIQEELNSGDVITLGKKRPTRLEFRR